MKSPVKSSSSSIFMGKKHHFYHQKPTIFAMRFQRPKNVRRRLWKKGRSDAVKAGEEWINIGEKKPGVFFTSFTKKKWLNRIEGSKFLWVLPEKNIKKLISAEMNEPVLPWPQGSRLPRSVRPDNGMLVVEDESPSSENSDFFLTVSCI